MRKILSLILGFLLFLTCGPGLENVERIVENGVEVVINHLEPYEIKGYKNTLILERELSIDTENDEIAETGLVDIEAFDVDDEGDLYFIRWTSNENFVFKFDNRGNFLNSFVRRGQGPGEINWGGSVKFIRDNELMIRDPSKPKYSIYSTNGEFLRDEILKSHIYVDKIFSNGIYLVSWQDSPPSMEKYTNHLGLCDSGFENIKEIYRYSFPNVTVVAKVSAPGNFWIDGASNDQILIGDGKLGYEILVFDLDGNMIRKIRKRYSPVELSEEYKRNYYERRKKSPILDKYELSKHFPPFQYLFTDEEDRIYVMTYEKGASLNEWIFDIFTPEGVFFGRVPIKSRISSRQIAIRSKRNRIYSICEKESGYKELVVYKMIWE